jgi:hypothetical protein
VQRAPALLRSASPQASSKRHRALPAMNGPTSPIRNLCPTSRSFMHRCCRASRLTMASQRRGAAGAHPAGPERRTGRRGQFHRAARSLVPDRTASSQPRQPHHRRRGQRLRPARRPPAAAEVRLVEPERRTSPRGQSRPVAQSPGPDPMAHFRKRLPRWPVRVSQLLELARPAFPGCPLPAHPLLVGLLAAQHPRAVARLAVALPAERELVLVAPSLAKAIDL